MRSARPAEPFPTARPSSTTMFRVSPSSIQPSFAPCAGPQPMPRPTASGSSSTAAGAPPRTRTTSAARRSPSTARKRKRPDGWPPAPRLPTYPGPRSTSVPPMPRRGCPHTAPRTGCARSTATNRGITNCARRPSITAALRCTPTRRTILGCSTDERASSSPTALLGASAGGEDRAHEAGDDVVDVAGDGDSRGDGGREGQALDIARDGHDRVEDCAFAQPSLLGADALGVPVAEPVVGERAGSALGVVDHGHLEQRAVRQDVLGDLADEGDVVDDLGGDPPAD